MVVVVVMVVVIPTNNKFQKTFLQNCVCVSSCVIIKKEQFNFVIFFKQFSHKNILLSLILHPWWNDRYHRLLFLNWLFFYKSSSLFLFFEWRMNVNSVRVEVFFRIFQAIIYCWHFRVAHVKWHKVMQIYTK